MLEEILAATRRRIDERRAAQPQEMLVSLAAGIPPPLDFAAALRRPGLQLIAEIKRRSPSRGDLRLTLEPADLATAYARGGAAALSVLTEPAFFAGSLDDLCAARRGVQSDGYALPILRKDFILDPYQVVETRAYGADAILLIAAALTDQELRHLYGEARRWGLAVLVEVHNQAELERALAIHPQIVGINSRNLRDMTVNLAIVEQLRPLLPRETLVVAESGIRGVEDVYRLRALGIDAILVGEALVRASSPHELAREFGEAGR